MLEKKQAFFKTFIVIFPVIWQRHLQNSSKVSEDAIVSKTFNNSAIVMDSRVCAKVGMRILKRGGTAVDAALAALICNGADNPQSMGIGGSLMMTIFHKESGKVNVLNARDKAPAYAHPLMYKDSLKRDGVFGPLSIGIPGEIMGYEEAKFRFGNPKISWKSLFVPTIKMLRKGVEIGDTLGQNLKKDEKHIRRDEGLSEIFVDPETDDLLQTGDIYRNIALERLLEQIAEKGAKEFYEGETARKMVEDIKEKGGEITVEDFTNYTIEWMEPLIVPLNDDQKIYLPPPPSAGLVTGIILKLMGKYHFGKMATGKEPVAFFQRLVEASKWAFGARTRLGDPSDPNERNEILATIFHSLNGSLTDGFGQIDDLMTVSDASFYGASFAEPPSDGGTSHISVMAPNGDAVSVSSSINLYFGSKIRSRQTGVIFNNVMDDFSYPTVAKNSNKIPPSKANYPAPGKRPISNMSPAIILDRDNNVKMVIGASHASKVCTSLALVILRHLFLKQSLVDSISEARLHHQLVPMGVFYEPNFKKSMRIKLEERGHTMFEKAYLGVIAVISVDTKGHIHAVADHRKNGGIAGE